MDRFCCTGVSVPCSLVVTCWERADLLAVVFCHFPKCVLVHIRIKGEVGALKRVLALQYFFLLTVKDVDVIYVLCFSCFRVFSLLSCVHLLGKGSPLGSCL